MPAIKTVLSFGLVAIPVALHAATQQSDVGFHQLHGADQHRIRYKKICEGCNKEIPQADIVKGYEYEKNRHVVVEDKELETIKTEKDKSIHILHFVEPAEVSSICYDKAYYAVPGAGGEKAFGLLRRALLEEGKIGIGKTVLGAKEAVMAIFPTEEGLAVQSLFFADEIKLPPQAAAQPAASAQELGMARKLVQSMDAPFRLADYKDEYQAKLRQLLEEKIAGEEISVPKKSALVNITDLMDAFRQSIAQAEKKPAKPAAKKTAEKKTVKKPAAKKK